MDPMEALSPQLGDAVTEVFNIGLHAAAGALGELLDRHVELGSSVVELLVPSSALETINSLEAAELVGAAQAYSGGFRGEGMLVLPARSGRNLVHILDQDEALPVLDVLYEVTNIMLSGCFAQIANIGDIAIFQEVPRMLTGKDDVIGEIEALSEDQPLVWVRCAFHVEDKVVSGLLFYIMDKEQSLLNQVRKILDRYEQQP